MIRQSEKYNIPNFWSEHTLSSQYLIILNHIPNDLNHIPKCTYLISKNETNFTVGQKKIKMHSNKFVFCGIMVFKTSHALNGTKTKFLGKMLMLW
jgi:hypothetical protein